MASNPQIMLLKTAVPCDLLLETGDWNRYRRSDQTEDSDSHAWRHPDGRKIVTVRNGTAWSTPDGSAHGDVFELVRHLDPQAANFADQRKIVEALATPDRREDAKAEIKARPSYFRLWQTHPQPKEDSPAWTWLADTYKIRPQTLKMAADADIIHEGPNATMWFNHRNHDEHLTGWQGLGPSFNSFARGGEPSLFTLDFSSGHPSKVVVANSPIEALSFASFDGNPRDTLYTAISGNITGETIPALIGQFGKLDPETGTIIVVKRSDHPDDLKLVNTICDLGAEAGIHEQRLRVAPPFWVTARTHKIDTALLADAIEPGTIPTEQPLLAARAAFTTSTEPPSPDNTRTPTMSDTQTSETKLVQRGVYQPVPGQADTQVSVDVGRSNDGFHYRIWTAAGDNDPVRTDWSSGFMTDKEAGMAGAMRLGAHFGADFTATQRPEAGAAQAAPTINAIPNAPAVLETNQGSDFHVALLAMREAALKAGGEDGEKLRKKIDLLLERAGSESFEGEGLQIAVGYLFYDAQRALGTRIEMPAQAREAVSFAGLTVPGLATNSPIFQLMLQTATLGDQKLVNEIRSTAEAIAQKPSPQNDPETRAVATRLKERIVETEVAGRTENAEARTAQNQAAAAQQTTGQAEGANQNAKQQAPIQITTPKAVVNVRRSANEVLREATGEQRANPPGEAPVRDGFDRLLAKSRKMFGPKEATGEMTRPAAYADPNGGTKFETFLSGHEQKIMARNAGEAAEAATQALTAANEVMGGLRQKIDQAARNDPEGYQGVFDGMRAGGQYAGLREEFSAMLQQGGEFASRYRNAISKVERYSTQRMEAEDTFKGPELSRTLDGKLEAKERDLYAAVSKMPGEEEGSSMIWQMAQKFGAMVSSMFERLGQRFGVARSTDPGQNMDQSDRPGPSPGM